MKILKIIIISLLIVVASVGAGVYSVWRSKNLQNILIDKVTSKVLSNPDQKNLFDVAVGMDKPKTYLVLLLNNTEMRPGGGFIGAYAIIKVDKGVPTVVKVEGTEILDNLGNKDFESIAPAPISKYLKVSRWYFRDSNWSPDFSISSKKSIELYEKQSGQINKIDAVIGFTPTVMEEILKIHGPIKVDGQEFNSKNFTEKLEYEVEYGFNKRGLDFSDRKNILKSMANNLIPEFRYDFVKNWQQYYALFNKLTKEKQIIFYSLDEGAQKMLVSKDWAGLMTKSSGDYLLWADSNMGALKTDVAIDRELNYRISASGTDKYLATAKMKFTHTGKFDWRTSRYRDYARIFVPAGSKLIDAEGSMEIEKSTKPGVVDQGFENGFQWFGTFISIEPGRVGELSFKYYLPDHIVQQIKNGNYELSIQKQLGTIDNGLTLDLDFGKKLIGAWPGEDAEKHGDSRYSIKTDLREDREFKVKLAN